MRYLADTNVLIRSAEPAHPTMNQSLEGIRPDTAERFIAQARAHGLSVDEYLKIILTLPETY